MKLLLLITSMCFYSFNATAQMFRQGDISDSLRTSIEHEICEENNCNEYSFSSYYQCLKNNLDDFVLVMLVVNSSIDSIKIDIPSIVIYGNYQNRFALEGGYGLVYKQYHDIYSSLFSYKEIDSVQIFDCRNITYLPIKSPDYVTVMENALFRRSWYIPGLDYYDLIGEEKLEDKEKYNEDWGFLAKEMDFLVSKYQF